MSSIEKHRALLNKSMNIDNVLIDKIRLEGKRLSLSYKDKLIDQAAWLNALYTKTIEPTSEEQKIFISKSEEVRDIIKSKDYNHFKALNDIEKFKINNVCKAFLKYKILRDKKQKEASSSNSINSNQKINRKKRYNKISRTTWRCKKNKTQYRDWTSPSKQKNNTLDPDKTYRWTDQGFQTREGHKIMSSKAYRNSRLKDNK